MQHLSDTCAQTNIPQSGVMYLYTCSYNMVSSFVVAGLRYAGSHTGTSTDIPEPGVCPLILEKHVLHCIVWGGGGGYGYKVSYT